MGGETPTGVTHPAARLHARPVWVLLGILLVSTGCATPVGITYGSTQDVYRTLTRSVLSAGKPSPLSEQTLLRLGLKERFETEPEEVLRQLLGDGTGLSRNLLFTLAELPFLQAEDRNRQDHYLAAAVEGEGGPQGLSDGVVAYESAHIEGVASEKIVRSSHSTQGNPETILEIERILGEHLGQPSTSKVDN
jgi:hypothetical protein